MNGSRPRAAQFPATWNHALRARQRLRFGLLKTQEGNDIVSCQLFSLHAQHFPGAPVHQDDASRFIGCDNAVTHIGQNRCQLLFLFVLREGFAQTAGHIVERLAELADLIAAEHRRFR